MVLGTTSSIADATIINTLNGQNYEWLNIRDTAGMSRSRVEALLADADSALAGYRYATRTETEDLLLSYISYTPGNDGVWTSQLAGATAFINDFGWTDQFAYYSPQTRLDSITGLTLEFDLYRDVQFLYGATGECGVFATCTGSTADLSFVGITEPEYLTAEVIAMGGTTAGGIAHSQAGFDSLDAAPDIWTYSDIGFAGSLLVRRVAEPASLILMGLGLVALGFTRREGAV